MSSTLFANNSLGNIGYFVYLSQKQNAIVKIAPSVTVAMTGTDFQGLQLDLSGDSVLVIASPLDS